MITVYFVDKIPQTFQSINYNCQGGFFMIVENIFQDGFKIKTTCIPSSDIVYVEILQ